jgi:hypothetical protein
MIQSPFLTALFHPVNLAMLALVVVAGLVAAWWLVPIGILLWIVMVIIIARDPGLQLTFSRVNRQPLAQRYQYRFDKLDRSRVTIFNAVASSRSPVLHKLIEPVQTKLDELIEHAFQLCLQLSALDNNYAVQKISGNFDSEIANLKESISNASDENSRKGFQDTLQSLQTRQGMLNGVEKLLTRFEIQLTGTSSAIDGVVMSIVGFRGRDPKQVEEKIPALLKVINAEQDKLVQFDVEVEKFSLI